MVIHTFAFKWKPGVTEEQKARVKKDIDALKGAIPEVLELACGPNISPRGGGFGFGGMTKFATREDLEIYNNHPVHQELLVWLMPLIDAVEVDYEV